MTAKIILSIATVYQDSAVSSFPADYLIGGIIAMLVMGYLIYVLLNPEKF